MKEYAHILHALADGKIIQFFYGEKWVDLSSEGVLRHLLNCSCVGMRIKPNTIDINGHEVPAPLRKALKNGQPYWIANPGCATCIVSSHTWNSDVYDKRWMERGVMHENEDAAIAHAKALLSFTEQKQ